MTNTKAFYDAVDEVGIKFKYIAAELRLTPNGLRKKVNNQTEFKASEIYKCGIILKLNSEKRDYIFLHG